MVRLTSERMFALFIYVHRFIRHSPMCIGPNNLYQLAFRVRFCAAHFKWNGKRELCSKECAWKTTNAQNCEYSCYENNSTKAAARTSCRQFANWTATTIIFVMQKRITIFMGHMRVVFVEHTSPVESAVCGRLTGTANASLYHWSVLLSHACFSWNSSEIGQRQIQCRFHNTLICMDKLIW